MVRIILSLLIVIGSGLLMAGVANAQMATDVTPMASYDNIDMGHSVDLQAFDAAVFQDRTHWINEYELVIVINKAKVGATKQTLIAYKNGVEALRTKTSTGRERVEAKRTLFKWHAPKKTYFSATNTGYFNVGWMDPSHKSKLWGTVMPWAIFFDGGIAVHQAPEGTEGALGKRASGGCVRISRKVAPTVYQMVLDAGKGLVPDVNQRGEVKKDSNGQILRKKDHRTLFIVQDIQD